LAPARGVGRGCLWGILAWAAVILAGVVLLLVLASPPAR
jgi:hypothetical protein